MPHSNTIHPANTTHPDTLTPPELTLLRLLLRGLTIGEAAALLQLTPDAGREMLRDLMRRQQVASPRHLLTRALVHRWVR